MFWKIAQRLFKGGKKVDVKNKGNDVGRGLEHLCHQKYES